MKMHYLFSQNTNAQPLLFTMADSSGRRVPRDEFKDLACKGCWKIKELTALERRIEYGIKLKHDYTSCFEESIVVSKRFRDILEEMASNEFTFFPATRDLKYFVLWPKNPIDPHLKPESYEFGEKCPECGRHMHILIGRKEPLFLEPKPISAIRLEQLNGVSFPLVVTDEACKILQNCKPKLSGMFFIDVAKFKLLKISV